MIGRETWGRLREGLCLKGVSLRLQGTGRVTMAEVVEDSTEQAVEL